MNKNILKLLIGLLILSSFSQVIAQDVITFNVNSKKQIIQSLETWSEVIMYHPTMSPTPSDLVIDLNSHNFTMSLKPDIESVNDNADPYDTDFSNINMNMGGKSGIKMSSYFPYIIEYKRLRDSMRVVNPALKPFTLSLKAGYFDRYIPTWIKVTAAGTAFIDSAKYAEYAENIYAQVKLYKDNTGVDVAYIDPFILNPGDAITPSNLCKLIGTLGSYLEDRGFTPALSIGSGLRLTATYSNQALLFNYITKVFSDPVAKKYVKNVNVDYDLLYGAASDAFFNKMVDTSLIYGFEITTELSYSDAYPKTWGWAGNGMKLALNISKMLNTAKANNVRLVYHSNFETANAVCMIFDTIGNSVAGLDDPLRKSTARKTEAYYLLRHLFKHTNPGSTYVLTSSSTNANILQTVVYDTITQKSTVFLVNRGTSSYTASLNYGTYNPGLYDVYRCSDTEIDVRLASINPTDNIILPARSLTVLTNDLTVPDTQAPTLPTGLATSNVARTSFTLTWNPSTDNVGVASYEVFRNGVSTGSTTGTTANISGLTCATTYSMTVRARDAAGNVSAASTALDVTTPICIVDNTAPSIPSELATSNLNQTSFTLTWAASTDNDIVVAYEVFKDGVSIGTTASTSINVTQLTCDTTYAMTVRASDESGNWSAQSTELNAATAECGVVITARGDHATYEGIDKLCDGNLNTKWLDFSATSWVQWQYPSPTIWNKYDIVSGGDAPIRDPKDWTLKGSNDGSNWTTLDTRTGLSWDSRGQTRSFNFSNGGAYIYYRWDITANQSGTIIQASEFTFGADGIDPQTPSVPTGLVSASVVQTSFSLSWEASIDDVGVVTYEVYKNGVSIGTTSSTSLSVTGLTCGTSYTMTVKAGDAESNWSAQSIEHNVATSECPDTQEPSVPTGLASSSVTQTSFTLNWTASTDNVGIVSYEVYVNGVSTGSTTVMTANISGLTCGTTYTMTVSAKDAAGNTSVASSALDVTTSACIPSGLASHSTADAIFIYPNPASNMVNLSLISEGENVAKIKVIDIRGKEVINITKPVVNGINNIQLPVYQLQNGLYFINLIDGNKSITKKFVVNK